MPRTALALALTTLMIPLPAMAEGDASAGEKVFRKCKACHQVGDGAENRTGPVLNGIVGAEAGAVADFDYSDAMKDAAADGLVWTPENLAAYLAKPRDFLKGTRMSFAGLRKEDDVKNVIAYLSTQD